MKRTKILWIFLLLILCGCSGKKQDNESYIGTYLDSKNQIKLTLKEDLTYELKGLGDENTTEGDYYIEGNILHRYSLYSEAEYAIQDNNIYWIFKGTLEESDGYVVGELVCQDKSELPEIRRFIFEKDGSVKFQHDFVTYHGESESKYKMNGDNIELDSGIVLEKNGEDYYQVVYKKIN